MKTVQISLNSIDKVKSFVNAITQFEFDFDLSFQEIQLLRQNPSWYLFTGLSKPSGLVIHAEDHLVRS